MTVRTENMDKNILKNLKTGRILTTWGLLGTSSLKEGAM
jgi:hypothetical protein